MTKPCGTADRLRCPYHGWTYDLEGRLKGVPEIEGTELDKTQFGLVPLAVATWEHFVFVNLDPKASLEAELGELVGQVAPLGLGTLKFAERREYTLQCNWKVFVDNYLERRLPRAAPARGARVDPVRTRTTRSRTSRGSASRARRSTRGAARR